MHQKKGTMEPVHTHLCITHHRLFIRIVSWIHLTVPYRVSDHFGPMVRLQPNPKVSMIYHPSHRGIAASMNIEKINVRLNSVEYFVNRACCGEIPRETKSLAIAVSSSSTNRNGGTWFIWCINRWNHSTWWPVFPWCIRSCPTSTWSQCRRSK